VTAGDEASLTEEVEDFSPSRRSQDVLVGGSKGISKEREGKFCGESIPVIVKVGLLTQRK